ncbi:O-antigen ligase family protein [Bradyrhizobium sp. HKCCYLR20261]|uniref:O-antigen ligase family protein n=1 Tax=Bradyrhizobium sp. HKCCYLR20261 TaxID=3420760 RepID=UPI003EC0A269
MTGTQGALFLLVLAAPATLLEGVTGWVFCAAAAALGLMALLLNSQGSLGRAWDNIRPAAPLAAVLVGIPLLQLVPFAPSSLTSPIWDQASRALQADIGRSVSLDRGATVSSLAGVLALVALAATTALIARDRQRAARLFQAACFATLMMIGLLLAGDWLPLIGSDRGPALGVLGSLGLVMAAALGSAAFAGRTRAASSSVDRRVGLVLCGLMAATGLLAQASGLRLAGVLVAAIGIVLCVLAARSPVPRFGTRTALGITAVLTLLAVGLVLPPGRDAVLALASAQSDRPGATMATQDAQRMLSETPPLGTGVGSFDTLAALYAAPASRTPPSAATKVYVEYGPVGAIILLAVGLFLVLKLVAGAARRGRDRHYSACAAALLVVLGAQSLWSTGPANLAPQIVLAVLVGVGLAQRRSADA